MILKFNSTEVFFYDSCKSLPALRYKDFQNYLLQDQDIGSDIHAIQSRAQEAITFFSEPDVSKKAILNIYFTINSIANKINHTQKAFACMVSHYIISGVRHSADHSDSGLQKTIDDLSSAGLTQSILEEWLLNVKKKSGKNWPFTFPYDME